MVNYDYLLLKWPVYWILAHKSNQIQIKSKSFRILILILKDFLCMDLDLDLIWILANISNQIQILVWQFVFADVASKLRPETHSFSLFSYFPRLWANLFINLLKTEDVKSKADENQVAHLRSEAL